MTLYYRDATVQVTSESICSEGHRIPLREVTHVWHTTTGSGGAGRSRLLGRALLVFLVSAPPLVGLLCLVSLGYDVWDRGDWKPAAAIVAVCGLGALVLFPFMEVPLNWLDRSYDRGLRIQELWIRHHDQEIMLVRSSDALRFGQIYRAVQRAVEQQDSNR